MPRYNHGEIRFVFNFHLVVFSPHFNAENVDKRILMNDPDLVHSQVQAIQRELEKVKTQLAAQVDINTAYQAEIDSLKRSIFPINLQAKVTFEPLSTKI